MKILGRFKYFAWMSNPMNALVTNKTLLDSKELLTKYKEGKEPSGTGEGEVRLTSVSMSMRNVIKISNLPSHYVLSLHPNNLILLALGAQSNAVLQICISSRFGGVTECLWKNVIPGSRRNAHHRSNVAVL